MSVAYQDYYKILGTSRSANADEIKQSFRKLARKYHPDKVGAGQKASAEAKFKEINEAYEVLKDPEKRKFYDAYGKDWEAAKAGGASGLGGRPFGADASRHRAGSDRYEYHFEGTGFSDFFEHLFGSGAMGGGSPFGGAQRRTSQNYSARGADIEGELLVTLNEVMNGSKRRVRFTLRNPHTGAEDQRDFNVRVPIGIHDGHRLRVAGLGEAGLGAGSAGDLYLRVRYAEHPDLQVQGQDLHCDLPITPWEGTLGAKVDVETLGERLRVTIQPGISSGHKLRLKGKGLPNLKGIRGDLYIIPRIVCPKNLTSEEKKLWETLARTSRFDPRR